eukprot:gene8227-11133_t
MSNFNALELLATNSNFVVTSNLETISKTEGQTLIGTHDGSFHCDEALAIGLLKLLPKYQSNSVIVRSRNPSLLLKCDVVVDVGAVYDFQNLRFDHHQREFTGVLEGFNTKLSSAGLIYKHFGKEIIRCILLENEGIVEEQLVDVCFTKLYRDFIEHVDAIDNGIEVSDGAIRYHISSTLSNRVGHLNPHWNEPQTPEILNERFKKAVALTSSEFLSHANSIIQSWWPARSIVNVAIEQRFSVHESGSIIIFSQACPWKEHLFDLEEAKGFSGQILYALYPDMGGSWRVQAVPLAPNSFDSRKKLPSIWCGLRDEVLSEKSGIAGCIFIHASGFIGGHHNKDGALALAIAALTIC